MGQTIPIICMLLLTDRIVSIITEWVPVITSSSAQLHFALMHANHGAYQALYRDLVPFMQQSLSPLTQIMLGIINSVDGTLQFVPNVFCVVVM